MAIDSNMVTALGVILFGAWEGTKWIITRKDAREARELQAKIAAGVDGMQAAARKVSKTAAEQAAIDRKEAADTAERASERASVERKAVNEAAERTNTAAVTAAGRAAPAASSDAPGNTIVENVEQLQAGRMSVAAGRRRPAARKKRAAPKRRKAR